MVLCQIPNGIFGCLWCYIHRKKHGTYLEATKAVTLIGYMLRVLFQANCHLIAILGVTIGFLPIVTTN